MMIVLSDWVVASPPIVQRTKCESSKDTHCLHHHQPFTSMFTVTEHMIRRDDSITERKC